MNDKIIVANWKMNPQTKKEAEILFNDISSNIKAVKNKNIIICPPYPFLFISSKIKNKKIILGAQNVSKFASGSHTGEISPKMLADFGVKFVIVGHSECRNLGEADKIINEKIINLLKNKLSVILCVGEKDRDHDGKYLSFVEKQLKNCLAEVSKYQLKNIIIAYEPVWAIGKDAVREATAEEFVEMKIFIKKVISDIYDMKVAHGVKVIYGGSVNSSNAQAFIGVGEADGLLVGRDSLNAKKFVAIINSLN